MLPLTVYLFSDVLGASASALQASRACAIASAEDMETEFLEPVLSNHACEVVCHINRCDKITKVVSADIIIKVL